jgi:hypothetical protein
MLHYPEERLHRHLPHPAIDPPHQDAEVHQRGRCPNTLTRASQPDGGGTLGAMLAADAALRRRHDGEAVGSIVGQRSW